MSTLPLDNLYTHNRNVGGEKHGEFCGSPIMTLNEVATDVDAAVETYRIIIANSGSAASAVDLLPGEVVCEDGIVRRDTSAEFIGYDEFHAYVMPENVEKSSIEEARKASDEGKRVYYRPNGVVGEGEFAIVQEEV